MTKKIRVLVFPAGEELHFWIARDSIAPILEQI